MKSVDLRDLVGTEKCGQPHDWSPLSICITYARWGQVAVCHLHSVQQCQAAYS